MGNQADYSLEVAHEIDEEVRALIEAAHTEAWDILNTYRDVLDDLVFELLEKETLTRKDLERIFDRVEKRPRITAFNDFGGRTPSDKPPIQTPAERARDRGEPWPPETEPEREPAPVGSFPAGAAPVPAPGGPGGWGVPAAPAPPAEQRPSAVPHNYGAPPDWRPATTPSGQTWPPEGRWSKPAPPQQPGWPQSGNGSSAPHGGNGNGQHPAPPAEGGPEQGGPR
jgi:cell division protease FtsH